MITPEAQGKMEAAQACAHVRNLSRKAWARREHSPLIVPHEWPSATPACARKPQNQRAGDRTASPPHHPDSGTTPTSPLLGLVPYFLSQGRMFLQGREQTASVRRAGQHSRGGGGGLLLGTAAEGAAPLHFCWQKPGKQRLASSKEVEDISGNVVSKCVQGFYYSYV